MLALLRWLRVEVPSSSLSLLWVSSVVVAPVVVSVVGNGIVGRFAAIAAKQTR